MDTELILITGAAGVMGRKLASALSSQGRRVRALCLPGDAAAEFLREAGVEVALGDVTRPETLGPAVQGADIVFHLAAVMQARDPGVFETVNAGGTANLVKACEAAGIRHFIHVSSISVIYPWSNAYARSKRRSEEIVRTSSLPFTIIRPSLAYEDGGGIEFMRFVDHLKRGPWIFLPQGGKARKNPVHVDDLVSGFLSLPDNALALGKTYAFTGGEPLSLKKMAQALLAHMGRPKPCIGFPLWLGFILTGAAWFWSRLSGRPNMLTLQSLTGLVQDAAPEDSAAAGDLGFRPRPFREGLPTLRSIKDCLAS